MLDHLFDVAKYDQKSKGMILVGGIISFIAEKFGVTLDLGINRIKGNKRIDIDTLKLMFMIPVGEKYEQTYQLLANRNQTLIILPNPAKTDTSIEQNFLYAMAEPQTPHHHEVEDEQVDAENLNEEQVQQEHHYGVQYGNEWCAKMEVESQWQHREMMRQGALLDTMYTNQQRQDTEVLQIGAQSDSTHRTVARMMRHMGLHDPAQGP